VRALPAPTWGERFAIISLPLAASAVVGWSWSGIRK
jgi:hypothetical protein